LLQKANESFELMIEKIKNRINVYELMDRGKHNVTSHEFGENLTHKNSIYQENNGKAECEESYKDGSISNNSI
jgi:hypothetical protein